MEWLAMSTKEVFLGLINLGATLLKGVASCDSFKDQLIVGHRA